MASSKARAMGQGRTDAHSGGGVRKQAVRKWASDDLAFALESAADFLENEEWPEDDGGAQVAANREAAKRIRRMAKRVPVVQRKTRSAR